MMIKKIIILASLILLCGIVSAVAQPTKVVIRAKARDAKFVGATLGVHVVVKNALTGEVLAKGLATGGSGNTKQIMYEPAVRGKALADSTTSKFEAVVDISEPTFVDIEVVAPANRRNGTKKVTTQTWLIPGKHILGDGIIVEIPGFIVDVLSPTTQQYITLASITNGRLSLKASVTMACGCVISKDGTWNSEDYNVAAIIKRNGDRITEVPLKITDTNNIFEVMLPIAGKGDYEVQVYAYDPKEGNVGLDRINFTVY
ncbi:hypothetical protein [Parapedobacter tibetensis]|uniref:hypothetical protein n=1 Tax=Parapedobacter tibetensis TaxID=2972951 RepID=UPI00214DE509|nr:hypothetical protein [Parapedobacter tibetensis]